MSKSYRFLTASGLLFLLIFPPLAFSAYSIGARTLIQLFVLPLLIIWAFRQIHLGKFPKPSTALSWTILILTFYIIASAIFSIYTHRSLTELRNVLGYIALFFLVITYARSLNQIRNLFWILAVLGSI